MPNWSELYQSLEIKREEGRSDAELIGPATDADIDAFETDTGLLLPPTYREYAKVFGPGVLAGYFTIAVPCSQHSGAGKRSDLRKFDAESPSHYPQEFLEEIFTETVRIKRLLYFGDTIGGDFIGWDRSEVTSEAPREYAIYLLARELQECVFLARSFPEFVEKSCFGHQLEITLRSENPDDEIERSFEPRYVETGEIETW